MTSITYVMPTRNRAAELERTLAAIGDLAIHDAEVIVVDNASDRTPRVPQALANGIPVRLLRRATNEGAAARNAGAAASDRASAWIVMLDDDSHPVDTAFLETLARAPGDVLAVSADIHLPAQNTREVGGLPEVFIGCGVALRRDAFLHAGGYDPAFGYYAEEYDLAARLLLSGGRITFDPAFRVLHHKVSTGRDMNVILGRLVRNNGWVMQRYAPDTERRDELRAMRRRYRAIARKENALRGFGMGLLELRRTVRRQRRCPMDAPTHARFTGLAAAREGLAAALRDAFFDTASIVDEGKNAQVIRRALRELGVREVAEAREAEALVIGSMSPGPMLDAAARRIRESGLMGPRIVAPWITAQRMLAPIEPVAAPSMRPGLLIPAA